jgi:20S proteasome alpha/beta subunit
MIYRIIALGTIDERILTVLAGRQSGHEALIAALKAEVRETVTKADRLKAARAAMQKAHPDHGGTAEEFIAARQRFEEEKRLAA